MSTQPLANKASRQIDIFKVSGNISNPHSDDVSVEEPLEIKVLYRDGETEVIKNISVTMRTPGNDAELALGFLFTEGIISSQDQIKNIENRLSNCATSSQNVITVEFEDHFTPNLMNADRNFYTTSSCGVCGKGSIEAIRTVSVFEQIKKECTKIELGVLYQLSDRLRSFQNNFTATGGIHASGMFDTAGNLLAIREDVGRHNALDKLIGYALSANLLPLKNNILLLSGRASFELIQKAAMAGITAVAAIGAPSSLAVDLAKEFDMTLIGFLRDNRFNIYHLGTHFKIENLS
ncbi:formate dehydrogenase accessory sulfurtransferase FdhD [Epilithonimonas sp. JDS]|uniref:formate dehydrogenase accessory sulfurtransferase FdhD n=1 Tax=Epilithonimonas sp. JDS TaxID=2902797 RepID=UPI001E3241CD|nr:formate dehydrogenase accessory sulfurtransferase FdhD [Epilithonimonas sp. JDS]MCD9856752.1 formate dehydrogenase accessory sulfurtransferase FdhD [Epilithonimonas sp. JDS]